MYLKLEEYYFGKEFVTIFIALSFPKYKAFVQFFFPSSQRVTHDQISAVSVNENKHAHQLQTGLIRYMILKLHGNETRSSCDQRLFFFSRRRLRASSPFGTQGTIR